MRMREARENSGGAGMFTLLYVGPHQRHFSGARECVSLKFNLSRCCITWLPDAHSFIHSICTVINSAAKLMGFNLEVLAASL